MSIPVVRKVYAVILMVVLATLFYILNVQKDKESVQVDIPQNQNTSLEKLPNIPEGGPQVHPVSLQAIMNKQYDGRDFVLGRILAEEATYTRYYITYKSGELTISGIMNVPKGDVPSGGFPILLLNHGYIDPAIYTNGRGLRREQDYLARNGYVVLHSDYRNHAQSDQDPDNDVNFRLGYVEDIINAIYAMRNSDLGFLNTEKIGMLGHSMGGGVTLNILVARPDLIDAAVLFAPVSGNALVNYERWTKSRPETASRISELYGTPSSNPDFWENVSANSFVERIQAPILLHHGTADADVPVEWSDDLTNLLRENGKEIDYRVYQGQPHEFTTSWSEVMRLTLEFYNEKLK